ncbi:MAG: LytTR family DNA-binding domain-containing protein [Acidobacteriota bacterium]
MEAIRVLIADDEPPARSRLRHLLTPLRDVEIVAESASGRETVAAIQARLPDLVFLDVQMPDLDGFDVVREIGPREMPTVIFVTAFDQYALRAFEACALDYLLKPFDDERFVGALERAREAVRRARLDGLCGKLQALLEETPSSQALRAAPAAPSEVNEHDVADRLVIRSAGRVLLVETADIDWIEGAGSYVRLHLGSRSHLLRQTLRHLEMQLDAECFVRIHRSTMVNRKRVRELRPRSHGESVVVLRDGTELKLSRSYRDRLDRLIRG